MILEIADQSSFLLVSEMGIRKNIEDGSKRLFEFIRTSPDLGNLSLVHGRTFGALRKSPLVHGLCSGGLGRRPCVHGFLSRSLGKLPLAQGGRS